MAYSQRSRLTDHVRNQSRPLNFAGLEEQAYDAEDVPNRVSDFEACQLSRCRLSANPLTDLD
jgi:hypothetical protein